MTLVDEATGEVVELTEATARDLTDRIVRHAEVTWDLIVEAYLGEAWTKLGYETWDAYCVHEFQTTNLRLPREKRNDTVQSLHAAGLSIRAIAAATGESKSTVGREITPPTVPNGTPDLEQATDDAPSSAGPTEPEAPPSPPAPSRGKQYDPTDDFRVHAGKAIKAARGLLKFPARKVAETAEQDRRDELHALATDLRAYADQLDEALSPGLKAVNR